MTAQDGPVGEGEEGVPCLLFVPRIDVNSKTEPGSAGACGKMRLHSNKAGCLDVGTDADEVSHVNGWVSLVSHIKLGLAYLIDLPEKMQAKTGKGKEKRQFFNRESQ